MNQKLLAFALVITLAYWLLTFYILRFGNRPKYSLTISRNTTINAGQFYRFAVLQSVFTSFFYIYLLQFRPFFPSVYTIIIFITSALFFVAAWIKDSDGWSYLFHEILARSAAFVLMLILVLVIFNSRLPNLIKYLSLFNLIYDLYGWIALALKNKIFLNNILIYQIGYLSIFTVIFLIAGFLI